MSRRAIQREDILRYMAAKRLTLNELGAYLLSCFAYGVPADEVGVYGRAWQLVQEMTAEQEAQDIAEHYTADKTCPFCGSQPRITGGRVSRTYCECGAYVIDYRRHAGRMFYRWTPSPEQGEILKL